MTRVQIEILKALRHGPLNQDEIAAEVDQAEFRVRAELRYLRSKRLVRDELTATAHVWSLTDAGSALAWADVQVGLFR